MAALTCLVFALGVRLVYLAAALLLDADWARPRHLQTTAIWLVALGFVRAAVSAPGPRRLREALNIPAFGLWLAFTVLALALFWPGLSVGLLSDDVGLVERAGRWDIGLVNDGFLRPLPMAAWAVLSKLGVGAWGLHAVNVVVHGTNAFLATLVAGQWVMRRSSQLLVGVFVLVSPIAAEPVVWTSGVFDVSSTLFVLLTLFVAGRHRETARVRHSVTVVVLALAAFATKESAIVLPALLIIHLWTAGVARPFAPRFDWMATVLLAAAYSAFRIVWAAEAGPLPALGWSDALRAIFSAFGSFAVPWRIVELESSPLPWVAIAIVIVLVTFGFALLNRTTFRAPLGGLAWVLIAIVPVAPFLAVGQDLEGSRYVYLASIGWAALFSSLVEVMSNRVLARARLTALIVVAALYVIGLRSHVMPWVRAGQLREAVLRAAETSDAVRRCEHVAVSGLPDSIDGAEAFRNTAVNMFAERGVRLMLTASPQCTFTWDAGAGSLRQSRP